MSPSQLQGGSEACSGPHLLCGLPDAVTHGLHVALLFLQLLLQLRDPGLQAALLVLKRVPKGIQPRVRPPAVPGLEDSLCLEEQCLRVDLISNRGNRLGDF